TIAGIGPKEATQAVASTVRIVTQTSQSRTSRGARPSRSSSATRGGSGGGAICIITLTPKHSGEFRASAVLSDPQENPAKGLPVISPRPPADRQSSPRRGRGRQPLQAPFLRFLQQHG